MTEKDIEIQKLQREINDLKMQLEDAKHIHMLDLAEIAYLRRQVDFFMEGSNGVSNRLG